MSLAADLFYSSNSDKETLYRRIVPSEEQRSQQKDRWNELADYLRDWLSDKTGFNVRTWIQGSYKFGTQIRPAQTGEEYDIDLGVYLEWDGKPNDEMTAIGLKHYVHDCVEEYATVAEGIRGVASPPKERCERVSYEGDFHIDVPGYHLDPKRDARSLATETKGWEQSDPKALVVWFRRMAGDDDDRTQLRRIIRYLKMWAALTFAPDERPSSILLTVIATDAYRDLADSDIDDDDVFHEVIIAITDRLAAAATVFNPIDNTEDLNRLDTVCNANLIAKLRTAVDISTKALAAQTMLESAILWGELFGYFFPVPSPEDVATEAAVIKSMAMVPVAPLDIEVIAKPSNGSGQWYSMTNSIGPIPKNYSIEFRLISNVPWSADIFWTVRNTGTEADEANDLGHSRGRDRLAYEHSAYNGTHYMDCTAMDNGRLIGFRRVPVIIKGELTQRRRFILTHLRKRGK